MPRQVITTANAPGSPFYSQGVKAGPHVLVSGIVGIDPSTAVAAWPETRSKIRQDRRLRIARPFSGQAASAWTMSSRWGYCSPTPPTSPA